MLTRGEQLYTASWSLLSSVALVVGVRARAELRLCTAAYWRFLLQPWKLALFVVALLGLTLMAPYTGDPTWDYVDASLMSLLTFAWAPWAIGAWARARIDASARELLVALIASLFAFSWCYDGYIILRDGIYTPTWASNMAVSAVIYVAAGMFWNLEHHPERGVIFSFMADDWPQRRAGGGLRLVAWMAAFVVPVAAVFLYFLWDQFLR